MKKWNKDTPSFEILSFIFILKLKNRFRRTLTVNNIMMTRCKTELQKQTFCVEQIATQLNQDNRTKSPERLEEPVSTYCIIAANKYKRL